jgi:hypothetical protein
MTPHLASAWLDSLWYQRQEGFSSSLQLPLQRSCEHWLVDRWAAPGHRSRHRVRDPDLKPELA